MIRRRRRIPVIVAGGANCNKILGESCNSTFPMFSPIKGIKVVHGDPLALHYT